MIELELEVGDEGKVDGQRFPVLMVWSAAVMCGDQRWSLVAHGGGTWACGG